MRQPASLSKALPRQDHQEYGPGPSPPKRRPRSTQPESNKRSIHARSSGRKPLFLRFAFQAFRSTSRWAMFRSPLISTCRPSARSSMSRAVIASRNAYFSACRGGVSNSPVNTYVLIAVNVDPSPSTTSASIHRPHPTKRSGPTSTRSSLIGRRLGMSDVPLSAEVLTQYVVRCANLLHQQQLRIRPLQPWRHPTPKRSPDPIHIHRGDRQHAQTLNAHPPT